MLQRLAILALVLASSTCFAQRRNTVYQQLFDNFQGSQASQNVRNYGQSQHSATVVLSGGSCTGGATFIAWFESSSDGTNYQKIGPGLVSIPEDPLTSTITATTQAVGAYPFVRFNVFIHSASCFVDVFYQGTLYPDSSPISDFVVVNATFSGLPPTGGVLAPNNQIGLTSISDLYAEMVWTFADDGGACTGLEIVVALEVSFDGSTWEEIGTFYAERVGIYRTVAAANYPQIRANVLSSAGTNCGAEQYWVFSETPFTSATPDIHWISTTAASNVTTTILPAKSGVAIAVYGFTVNVACDADLELEAATTTSLDYYESPNVTGGFVESFGSDLETTLFVLPDGEALRMVGDNGAEGTCDYSISLAYTYR